MSTSLTDAALRLFCAGFIIAAPLGPVAFFVFQSVLKRRFSLALIAGAGAATADALLGFSALMGLKWVGVFVDTYQKECHGAGGLFLLFLGVFLLKSSGKNGEKKAFRTSPDRLIAFGTGFGVTLLNPLTFTAFIAAFSLLNIQQVDHTHQAPEVLTLFLFGGAFSWWVALSLLALWGKKWVHETKVASINKGVSLLLLCCGVGVLVKILL